MTEETPEQPEVLYIHSELWKSAMLSTNSTFFPRLVEAAAWKIRRPYHEELLRWVSTNSEILEELHIPINEGSDAVLTEYVTDKDQAVLLDDLIVEAVTAYQLPPPTEPIPDDSDEEYPVWKQPSGYADAYDPGAIVWYPNKGDQLYRQAYHVRNAWEPTTPHAQWVEYDPTAG